MRRGLALGEGGLGELAQALGLGRLSAAAIGRANEQNDGKVVTTIEPRAEWYPAEDYHQDYWAGEGQQNSYCIAVIPPKLAKLRKSFQARVKSEAAATQPS